MFVIFKVSHADVFIEFIQGINFSQTQQFVTQNILMATCFDSTESSSRPSKEQIQCIKIYSAF